MRPGEGNGAEARGQMCGYKNGARHATVRVVSFV